MRTLLLIAILAVLLPATAQRTMRRDLKAKPTATAATADARLDTVVSPEAHTVEFNGYDKPLRSRRETFFATNNGTAPVRRLAFTISYYDLDRHLLHRASHNVEADIPAGEQRMVGVRSWDVQLAFYYTRTTVDHKSSKATPYDIEISIDTLFAAAPQP